MFSRFETMYLLALLGLKVKTHELKRSGNRTEWSTIQGVIRQVIMVNWGWNIFQSTKFLLNQLTASKAKTWLITFRETVGICSSICTNRFKHI